MGEFDEAIELYYGQHSMKQFTKGELMCFGHNCFECIANYENYIIKTFYTFSYSYIKDEDKQRGHPVGGVTSIKLCAALLLQISSLSFLSRFKNLRK